MPGEETSSTYRSPMPPGPSSQCSMARLARAQSSADTPCPPEAVAWSRRMRSTGRWRVPPRRRSTSSYPSPARSSCSGSSRGSAVIGDTKKKCGELPHIVGHRTAGRVEPAQRQKLVGGSKGVNEAGLQGRTCQEGHHPAVSAPAPAVAEKPVLVVGRAPPGGGDLPDPQALGPAQQLGPYVHVPRPFP